MVTLMDLKPLYVVNISFSEKPESTFYSPLAAMAKLLAGQHAVLEDGSLLPLLEGLEISPEIERKEAVIDFSRCEADLHRLHRFYTGQTQGNCEEFSLPHMHFRGGGIEEIGAVRGGFYLPSIAREAEIDEKTRRFLGEAKEESVPR